MIGYKLFRVRKDGSIGPLFFDRRNRLPIGVWMKARHGMRKKGFAYRPGWHITHAPDAPHLSKSGRRWYVVEFKDYREEKRAARYGGVWYIAEWMKIREEL